MTIPVRHVGPHEGTDIVTEPQFVVRGNCLTPAGVMVCVEATVLCQLRFGGLPVKDIQPVLRGSVIEYVKKTIRKFHQAPEIDLEAVHLLNRAMVDVDDTIFQCIISDYMEKELMGALIRDLQYFRRGARRASDLISTNEMIKPMIKDAEDHLLQCFSCRTQYHERLARTQNRKITEFRHGLIMIILRKEELAL